MAQLTAKAPRRAVFLPSGDSLFNLLVGAPERSPRERKLLEIAKRYQQDVYWLRERIRRRLYQDTLPVLVFYWLRTIREMYTAEEWPVVEAETKEMLQNRGQPAVELRALQYASEWIGLARPVVAERQKPHNRVRAFTSEHLAPSGFVSQAYLEALLSEWVTERVLEVYGTRPVKENWNCGDAYQETALCLEDLLRPLSVYPDVEVVRGYDRLQKRPPMPVEEVVLARRRRQAALESLVRAAPRDASVVDPKQREILNDVILYLLGATHPAPPAEPGYAWLFPGDHLGANLPPDFSNQVSESPLPENYENAGMISIHLRTWPAPQRMERGQTVSLHSTLLTPDGRVWEAHHMEQLAGSAPDVVFRAIGRIDVTPAQDSFLMRVPVASWPTEIGPEVNREREFELYQRRWHFYRFEGSAGPSFLYYKSVPKPGCATIPVQPRLARLNSAWEEEEDTTVDVPYRVAAGVARSPRLASR